MYGDFTCCLQGTYEGIAFQTAPAAFIGRNTEFLIGLPSMMNAECPAVRARA